MSNNNNSNNDGRDFMLPLSGNSGHSTVETLMQLLHLPDNKGDVHSFLELHEDLQRDLRALAPWQLALLGYHAATATPWTDETLQDHQTKSTYKLIPEHMMDLVDNMCFYELEEIADARQQGYPVDAWYWLFRQDPTKPRQDYVPLVPAPKRPEVTYEQPEYPSKRRCLERATPLSARGQASCWPTLRFNPEPEFCDDCP